MKQPVNHAQDLDHAGDDGLNRWFFFLYGASALLGGITGDRFVGTRHRRFLSAMARPQKTQEPGHSDKRHYGHKGDGDAEPLLPACRSAGQAAGVTAAKAVALCGRVPAVLGRRTGILAFFFFLISSMVGACLVASIRVAVPTPFVDGWIGSPSASSASSASLSSASISRLTLASFDDLS